MNRKQRRIAQSQEKPPTYILLQGRQYTLEAADALAIHEKTLGNYPSALSIYALILQKFPHQAVVYNNVGNVLLSMRRLGDALAAYNQAIAFKADYAEAYFNRGKTLQELGRYAEALASYDKSIALMPHYAVTHNNRGNTLQSLKRLHEALASYDLAIALQPDQALNHYNRGNTLQDMLRFEEAVASYDKAIALKPDFAEAYNNRGNSLQKMKRYDDAIASCDKAIDVRPDYAEAYQNRGVALVNKGKMQHAETMFLRAHALKPDFLMPLFSLTNIRKYKDPEHADIKRIETLLEQSAGTFHEQEYLCFALGKMYDDCGLYDKAFGYYQQANHIRSATLAYDSDKMTRLTDTIIATFTKEFLSQPFAFASQSRTPIFIVGMPRSGTTLMANILSNHHCVSTAGELRAIIECSLRLPKLTGGTPYPQAATQMTAAIAAVLIEDYEKQLRQDTDPAALHVVDKHPLNFRHLGLIAMLFPHSHIIHTTRHPYDTALSNYFQLFAPDYDYSFDLRSIGHFYNEYARIMQHWRDVLPIKMLDVPYEDMIGDTERITREALDFLELEWDECCLSPHTNPCAVETASQWQVRQPIYKRSVERWRHYEKYLGPLKETLTLPDLK